MKQLIQGYIKAVDQTGKCVCLSAKLRKIIGGTLGHAAVKPASTPINHKLKTSVYMLAQKQLTHS